MAADRRRRRRPSVCPITGRCPGFNVAADRRRRRRIRLSSWATLHRLRFNVAADRRRRRPKRRGRALDQHPIASTWPPTVVGGDAEPLAAARRGQPASTWPPTVVGGDATRLHATDVDSIELQRGRRPSSAETCKGGLLRRPGLRFNVAADRRRRRRRALSSSRASLGASTWPPTVVGGDAETPEQRERRERLASTWPPTVVGGDLPRRRRTLSVTSALQRGRRPSSAETRPSSPRSLPQTTCFNVAADRRRRRPPRPRSRP